MDTENTVTGQCDHIVGLFLNPYIQNGESDRLVRQSEGLDVDEPFSYCPCCGEFMAGISRSMQNLCNCNLPLEKASEMSTRS